MSPVMSPVTNFPFIGPTGVFWSKKNVNFFYEMRELFVKLYESQKWIPQEFIFDKKNSVAPTNRLCTCEDKKISSDVKIRALVYVSDCCAYILGRRVRSLLVITRIAFENENKHENQP